MSELFAQRFIVAGRVQGVWFRVSAQAEARRLGITGHAINLPDGRVEVFACGELGAINSLARWLQTGPPLARVSHVESGPARPADDSPPGEFRCG